MSDSGIRRRASAGFSIRNVSGHLRRLLRSPAASLDAEQRAQLVAMQVDASRPAYAGVLLWSACLVLALTALELMGWISGIGYPPAVSMAGGLMLAALSLASMRVQRFWWRSAILFVHWLGLAILISMPIDGSTVQLAFRTGLFNLVPIAALALTVRSASTWMIVGLFVAICAARISLYGTPLPGAVMYWAFSATSIAFGLMLRRYRIVFAVKALNASHALWTQASTDELTGLLNRTGWNRAAPKLMTRATLCGKSLSAVFFDIDRFKKVNDTHGHAIGDEILCGLAAAISRLQPVDSVSARFGGEEFVVLLAAQERYEAIDLAERVRHAFAAAVTEYGCRVSAGVAYHRPGEGLGEMLRRADLELYSAKSAGRDRVSVAK